MSFSQSGLPLPLPSSSSSHRLNSGLSSAPSSSNLTAAPQPNSHTLVQPNSHAHAHAQAPRKSLGFGLDSYSPVTNIDHYNMLGCIGQGSFGVIHKIQRKSDGTIFALKQLDYSRMNPKDRRQMLAEVAILDSLKHPHVVMLIDKILDKQEQRLYIVMEYCGGGDLSTTISTARRAAKPIPESQIWNYFLQLTLALHHCHWPEERANSSSVGNTEWQRLAGNDGSPQDEGGRRSLAARAMAAGKVLHRDLKPENIFLDEQGKVKLGDFGLSKNLGGNRFTKTYVGTPLYMPPEILAESEYGTKSDIWSLGCLIYELCTLVSPFAKAKTQSELKNMVSSKQIPPMPGYLSKDLKDAVRWMLTLEAEKRPSTMDLLNMDRMRLQRQILDLDLRMDAVTAFKREVVRREGIARTKEKEIVEREATVIEREKRLEQEVRTARGEYQTFLQAKDRFKADQEAWENEKARERFNGAAANREASLKSNGDSAQVDWPRSGVVANASIESPEAMRRHSHLPRKSLIPTRLATDDKSSSARGVNDSPSKIPGFAALSQDFAAQITLDGPSARATPLRSRLKTKSMNNLGARARDDAENSPPSPFNEDVSMMSMDTATPIRPGGGRLQAASISSPQDMRRLALKSQQRASEALAEVTGSSSNTRAPPTPRARGTTLLPQQTFGGRNSVIGGPVKHTSSSFIYKEQATPAKWSVEADDAPSPFIKRPPITSAASVLDQPKSSSSTFNRMPRSKSGGGIARLVAERNARAVDLASAQAHYPL